jgi:squalene-hopene/tetraprenyl-beta-curcumene cyclase
MRSHQRADGSWAHADGSQQILCTSAAIRGLVAAGATTDDDSFAAAANWLVVQQEPTGGWNGSATETAWALLALVAAGKAHHVATRRGIDFLVDFQDDDGGWIDSRFVERDPLVNHWFRNELHGVAWPLLALSKWAVAASSAQPAAADEISLRLVAATSDI